MKYEYRNGKQPHHGPYPPHVNNNHSGQGYDLEECASLLNRYEDERMMIASHIHSIEDVLRHAAQTATPYTFFIDALIGWSNSVLTGFAIHQTAPSIQSSASSEPTAPLNSQDEAIRRLVRAYASLYGDHHAGGYADPSFRASAEAEGKRKAQAIVDKGKM